MLAILMSLFFNIYASDHSIAFGVDRKPYIDEKNQKGIVQNIFYETFSKEIPQLKYSYLPNYRLQEMLKQDHYDIIVEVQPEKDTKYFFSDRFIAYYNYFVVRDGNPIKTFSDLKQRVVCTWQNAKENLGGKFQKALPSFKEYREFAEQEEQVKEFIKGKCDVVIIDKHIFQYYENLIQANNSLLVERNKYNGKAVKYYPIPVGHELWWYVAFKSSELRDKFNAELKKINANGRYLELRGN